MYTNFQTKIFIKEISQEVYLKAQEYIFLKIYQLKEILVVLYQTQITNKTIQSNSQMVTHTLGK